MTAMSSWYKAVRLPLLAGLVLWVLFTWPLTLHFGRAIPARERRPARTQAVRSLEPGDHLQLLYHFWLARDMLTGGTPLFANVYEFNTGHDADRYRPEPYYLPFSLLYAAVAPLAGDASAWNFALLASVLLGLGGTYVLARRFKARRGLALAIALVANALPYRWINLLCGSPTGYAMGLVPWLLVGLDLAVRGRRAAGGWLAGAALLAAYGSDLHVFYFSMLLLPAGCLLSWLADPEPMWPDRRRVRAVLLALLPTLAAGILAALAVKAVNSQLMDSAMAGGRSWNEIKLFSPVGPGLVRWHVPGASSHAFLGIALGLLLAVGAFGRGLAWRTGPTDRASLRRHAVTILLPACGLAAIVLLAWGTHGPANGLALRLARRLLPKYDMIRQPVKIYCLLPSLLAATGALLFVPWQDLRGRSAIILRWTALTLAVATIAEYRMQLRPGLCGLPDRMPAYEAAVEHASARDDRRPHAVVLPLWPGESHYASVYEYGVTKSRLRLLNGYAPAVPLGYFERVFRRFESLNQGVMEPWQSDALREIGVRYVLFHEQPYPHRVSPFPATIALRRLLRHPMLDLLTRDGPMWCFFLRDRPRQEEEIPSSWGPPLYAGGLTWAPAWPDEDIPSTEIRYSLRARAPIAPAPDLRYLMFVEGPGSLRSAHQVLDLPPGEDGQWIEAPFSLSYGDEWRVGTGRPHIRYALLTAGTFPRPDDAGRYRWAAADFYHQGATDPIDGSLRLEPQRDPQGLALYGPNLPFAAGRWQATLLAETTSGADKRVLCGHFIARPAGGEALAKVAVWPERPAKLVFDYDGARPLQLEFHYHRRHAMRLSSIELTPAPAVPTP